MERSRYRNLERTISEEKFQFQNLKAIIKERASRGAAPIHWSVRACIEPRSENAMNDDEVLTGPNCRRSDPTAGCNERDLLSLAKRIWRPESGSGPAAEGS